MTKQVSKASAALAAPPKRGPRRAARPRRRPAAGALVELWSEIKRLGQRGGETLVDAYVTAARSVLAELERLEDASAERRYQQRATQAARARARTKQLPPAEGA